MHKMCDMIVKCQWHIIISTLNCFICAETPEPPKSCELRNDTILEVVCVAGFDGGLSQSFLLEVVGGIPIYNSDATKSMPDMRENEISTMNDQVCVYVIIA